ncbi:MAG: bifunctional DNA-formamidopyrimidine glycosylase/DNA-(apurinic or apyrimidinic site) lyase [Planctomycetes bacterium]|nr:bifunctional DNA-formamidopyrimidine glycosylase/DNA-(apurinic or apyrimidinic site) lyase [Planctomycetota bacterium]
MPELPEVETVVRDLRPLLVDRRFVAIRTSGQSLRAQWEKTWEAQLLGSLVRAIRRRGKWILIDLEPAGLLVLHLGMTGQLTVVSTATAVENHVHLTFDLDTGDQQLRFRDIRRFGSATYHQDEQEWITQNPERLGPEPFDMEARYFREKLAKTDRSLKAILLDQSVVAGVGNIYADESLYTAKLDPRRRGRDLQKTEADRLRKAIVTVLTRAIKYRGSTIRNYVGGSGLKGGYQDEFLVYGRTEKPCYRCKTPIECIRLAGRSTHFCPACQLPEARR